MQSDLHSYSPVAIDPSAILEASASTHAMTGGAENCSFVVVDLAAGVSVPASRILRGGSDEFAEQAASAFVLLDQHLGMPLHTDHEPISRTLEPFDQTIRCN